MKGEVWIDEAAGGIDSIYVLNLKCCCCCCCCCRCRCRVCASEISSGADDEAETCREDDDVIVEAFLMS